MRDLLVFLVVLMGLPTAFRRPFLGLLLFSWLAYMRPQDLCWGFARTMRFSFFAGFAMIAGWWAYERGRRPFAVWDGRALLMVVLVVLVSLSYAFARFHEADFTRYWFEFLKIIVIALFTTGQVDSRQRFRILVWTIAICLSFYGIKGGLFGVLSGGRPILRGPGGMLEDNNDFALALVMNVPLLWYLGISEKAIPWAKTATRIGVVLTVITIALTGSRGGFLALVGTALWIAWRSRRLFQAGAVLAVLGVLFLALAPREVTERIASIAQGGAESSAGARLIAWETALRMIADNPVLGVGMRNFQPRYLEYALVPPGAEQTSYVAHNSYLQIWAESGTLAFLVYVALLASVFLSTRRVYQIGLRRPDLPWALDYARMMEATTVGFLIGATFLNRGHFDLIYHWLGLVTCLHVVTWAAVLRPATASDASAAAAATGERGVVARWRSRTTVARRWERAT